MTGLTVHLIHHAADSTLILQGELDLTSTPLVIAAIETVIAKERRHLTVDLAGLAFCDSCGLRELLHTHQRLTDMGGSMRVINAYGSVLRVLTITGVDKYLTMPASGVVVPPPDVIAV